MEELSSFKKLLGETLISLIKERKDLKDEIEEYKFDAAIGKFIREFENIKSCMLSFICQCFITNGLHETNDMMVKYLFKEMKIGSIHSYLVPMYKFVDPTDQKGHKGLEDFSKNIGALNSNRNTLIHQYHLELAGTMKDSGRTVTVRSSVSTKPSPDGPTVKGVIYKTDAIEENTEYVKDVQYWLKQCTEKLTKQGTISDLLAEFNQKPVPSMGKFINIPSRFPRNS